jgi:ribosomal protein S18
MEELADTGLSRVELLFDNMEGKGVQLKDDPFFQLVKSSRVVREMMVPPGGEFSADRVIEAALRQDFGPDASVSAMRESLKLADDSHMQPTWEYKKKYRDRDPTMSEQHLFAGSNFLERQERLASHARQKPATFINRPLTRGQLRKRFMRSIAKKDIEWKNLPFLAKFLNESGRLLNRYQTRMETVV